MSTAVVLALIALSTYQVGRSSTVIEVDSFLRPGNGNQSVQTAASIQAAVDAAVKAAHLRPTTLVFGRGREYRIAASGRRSTVIVIANATGPYPLTIDGRGARLVITSPRSGLFGIGPARELHVGNLTIDYDPLPMTQGKVIAVHSPTQYTLQIDPGFPSLMLPHFLEATNGRWMIIKERAAPTRHKVGTRNLNVVKGWIDRGDGIFDVTLQSNLSAIAGPEIGDVSIFRIIAMFHFPSPQSFNHRYWLTLMIVVSLTADCPHCSVRSVPNFRSINV